MSVFRFFKPF